MDDRFKNIDVKKRNKILNSAFEEFATNNYSKASTNNIVKKAGISRGLLYHYFANKKDLYNYLKKYSMDLVMDEVNSKIDWEIGDIFERLKQIILIKLSIFETYPFLVDFFSMMISNDVTEELTESELNKLQHEYKETKIYKDIYSENIDFSKFRDDIDVKKALDIIRWTMEKYSEEIQRKMKFNNESLDYSKMKLEIDEYNEILKESFYK